MIVLSVSILKARECFQPPTHTIYEARYGIGKSQSRSSSNFKQMKRGNDDTM